MRTLVKVDCSHCGKKFLKYYVYVRDNKNLGHEFYCSSRCQFENRKTGAWLLCENESCKKQFYRVKNAVLKHNFCSKSCAAIVNNRRYPKWPKRFCLTCGKEFKNRSSDYCSSKCGWSAQQNHHYKHAISDIVPTIKKLGKELGRSPARRELGNMSHAAIREFGSWNKAIEAAGLKPHRSDSQKMYRRTKTKARDGHVCDSISEAIIDNWLHKHKIPHARDAKYPTTKHRADWSIQGGKVFIEYFGLAKDSPRYDREIKIKQELCRKNKIKLLEIYSSDLYPTVSLSNKLLSLP